MIDGDRAVQRETMSGGMGIGALAMLCAMLSTNTGAAFAKTLFPTVGAFGMTALRVGFASALLMVFRRPWRRPVARQHMAGLIAYGAILGLMNSLFYQAFARIPIGIAVAIEVTGPLTIALLGSRRLMDLLWVACAAGGLLLLTPFLSTGRLDPVGMALALGAGVCWALYIVFGKRVSAPIGGDAVAWGMAIAAVLTVPVGVYEGGKALLAMPALIGGLGVAALSSAVPYSLEMEALRRVPAHVFGILTSGAPAVAALAGFLIVGEHISAIQWGAILLITTASAGSAAFAPNTARGA